MTIISCDHIFKFEFGLKGISLTPKVVINLQYPITSIGEDQMGLGSNLQIWHRPYVRVFRILLIFDFFLFWIYLVGDHYLITLGLWNSSHAQNNTHHGIALKMHKSYAGYYMQFEKFLLVLKFDIWNSSSLFY